MELPAIYQYTRLKNPDHIRLVQLQPPLHENDHQLRVELRELSLASADGIYTALSYACGDTSNKWQQPALCQNKRILIYPTLYSALLKLRHRSESRLIWCDGLCIDQGRDTESLKERSAQVQMMSGIYSNAQEVGIDLGNDLGQQHTAFFESLSQIAAISIERFRSAAPANYEYAPHERDAKDQRHSDTVRAESSSVEVSHGIKSLINILPPSVQQEWLWQGFADLLQRPYFKRLWVFQEHALGRKAFFMLGRTEINGRVFARGVSRLQNILSVCSNETNEVQKASSNINEPAFGYVEQIFRARHLKNEAASGGSWNRLDHLVHSTIAFDCFDNRDKVYGLLGLCRPEDRHNPTFRVDYSEPLESFAIRLSVLFLSRGAPFVLYRCAGCKTSCTSWAIDLALRWPDTLSDVIEPDGSCAHGLFSAGNITTETSLTRFRPSFSIKAISPEVLVSVVLLPAIRSVSPMLALPVHDGTKIVSIISTWLRELLAWAFEESSASKANATAILTTITVDTLNGTGSHFRTSRYVNSAKSVLINAAFRQWINYMTGSRKLDTDYDQIIQKAIPLIQSLVYANNRRVAKSVLTPTTSDEQHSMLYLVPKMARPGDVVAVFVGLPLPFVLRPVAPSPEQSVKSVFRIVGSAYAHGMMDGQVFDSGLPKQDIVLI